MIKSTHDHNEKRTKSSTQSAIIIQVNMDFITPSF